MAETTDWATIRVLLVDDHSVVRQSRTQAALSAVERKLVKD